MRLVFVMARSMLLEPASFTFADAIEAATAIVESQTLLIQDAMGALIQNPLPEDHVVLSGQGEILARRVFDHYGLESANSFSQRRLRS